MPFDINFVNQEQGGFMAQREVADGTTVGQFIADVLPPDTAAEDYVITVDRQEVTADHVLTPNCRISMAPQKVAGALPPLP